MQFEAKYRKGIADGSVTLTFRRWKRPQVISGKTYRTAAGRLVIDSVRTVDPGSIADDEAIRAGHPSAEALRADMRGDPALPICRVAFHLAPGEDPRDELAADAVLDAESRADITRTLERLDRASRSGAWTHAVLTLIAANPAVRAGDLAPRMGQELPDFKLNVRKLKNLGLTISLGTGYRLSPRGEAFLARLSQEN